MLRIAMIIVCLAVAASGQKLQMEDPKGLRAAIASGNKMAGIGKSEDEIERSDPWRGELLVSMEITEIEDLGEMVHLDGFISMPTTGGIETYLSDIEQKELRETRAEISRQKAKTEKRHDRIRECESREKEILAIARARKKEGESVRVQVLVYARDGGTLENYATRRNFSGICRMIRVETEKFAPANKPLRPGSRPLDLDTKVCFVRCAFIRPFDPAPSGRDGEEGVPATQPAMKPKAKPQPKP